MRCNMKSLYGVCHTLSDFARYFNVMKIYKFSIIPEYIMMAQVYISTTAINKVILYHNVSLYRVWLDIETIWYIVPMLILNEYLYQWLKQLNNFWLPPMWGKKITRYCKLYRHITEDECCKRRPKLSEMPIKQKCNVLL